MAENKKSFIAYADWITVIKKLVLRDRENGTNYGGELFLHILEYVNDNEPIPIDFIVEMAFEPIKLQLKRDLEKWSDERSKRSEAGRKGGLARARNAKQIQAPLEIVKPAIANQADTVNVTVTVTDTVNDTIKKEYIYSKFYDLQIETTTNENYIKFVKYLFGENMLKQKLSGILSITNQLTVDEFIKVLDKCKANKKKIGDILTKIENDKKYYKGKISLYRTLLNWANDTFAK